MKGALFAEFDSVASCAAIPVGQLAKRLHGIMKEIHKANYLLTSIKLENFMIARGNGSIVDRLRWVHLSLLEQCPIDNRH